MHFCYFAKPDILYREPADDRTPRKDHSRNRDIQQPLRCNFDDRAPGEAGGMYSSLDFLVLRECGVMIPFRG